MNFFKKVIVFFILSIFVIFVSKAWHVLSGGFRTNKIVSHEDFACEVKELPENLDEKFFSIFDQKYKYLGKGCQVYVFESSDKKYVIKFLRHHKYKPPFWINLIDFIKKTKAYKERIVDYKKSRVKNAFNSYLMAYRELKEETAVVYLHLGKTNHIKKKILIEDKFGQKSVLDLDKTNFVVQKKLKDFSKTLLSLSKKNNLVRAKVLINGYFEMIKKRSFKNIKNIDRSGYIRNMGHVKDRLFEMDLGGYRKKEHLTTKEGFEMEIIAFSRRFRRWAEKRAPNLVSLIDEKTKEVLK